MKQPQQPQPSALKVFFGRHKKVVSGVIILAAALFVSQVSFIIPIKTDNGNFFIANYDVAEEDFDHPKLRLLRQREHLDEVIRPGETQFDKLVLLRKWTRKQWEHKEGSFYYPPWDALEILDLARKYDNRGFCAQYAIVFLQACLAVGRHARYIDLPGHFVAGVWSDGFNKWVVMDPYNDLHYEKNGIPLNGVELCDAYINKDIKGIAKVTSDGVKTQITLDDIAVYRSYAVSLRNDHLTEPMEVRVNGALKRLTHNPDYHAYPLVGRDNVTIEDFFLSYKPLNGAVMEGRTYTENRNDFKRDINQTIIYYLKSLTDSQSVKVVLLTDDAPTFKTFLISINDAPWQEAKNKLLWELDPGFNKLSARILTKFGWQGRVSSITLFYKAPWLFNSSKSRNIHRITPKSI